MVNLPQARRSRNIFLAADAPPAAVNRALRRAWMATANAVLRRTGDPDAALRAAAQELVAALDCDSRAYETGRKTRHVRDGGHAPFHLRGAARQRELNREGAHDAAVEAILRGERP